MERGTLEHLKRVCAVDYCYHQHLLQYRRELVHGYELSNSKICVHIGMVHQSITAIIRV